MGEYAIRKSDGAEIKIGTCEDMYYLRFSDRNKVRYLPGNVDVNDDRIAGECRFRLPFADEDEVLPGEYDEYNRCCPLHRKNEWFSDDSRIQDVGRIQLHHESGLLLNVDCFHGLKLPDVGLNMKAFWNGKSPAFVLSSLRGVMQDGSLVIRPVVRCKFCDEAWRYEWEQVWEWIPYEMRIALREYSGITTAVAS